MSADFQVTFPEDWENYWREIQARAKEYGFSLKKRANTVKAEGKVIATISISGRIGYVEILKKPVWITNSMIQKAFKKFMKHYS